MSAPDPVALVRCHQSAVWRYLRVLGCGPHEAEDLAQETFLAVLRSPFQDRGTRASRAYLLRVARNLFLKSRRRRQPTPIALEEVDLTWHLLWGKDGGDAYVLALRSCLQRVEGRPEKAVDLVYRQGLSHREAAAALGMTRAGVTNLLRKVRAFLHRCIEREVAR